MRPCRVSIRWLAVRSQRPGITACRRQAKPASKSGPAKEKARRKAKDHHKAESPRAARNILPFAPEHEGASKTEPAEIASLKKQVQRAMKALEQGKQVAAFGLLKRILDS